MTKRSALQQSDSILSIQSTKSNVSFTTIEVHEHAMILGDGPSASGGPAVQLDWSSQSDSTMSVEEYEASKIRPKKSIPQMMIPGSFRTAILVESGYTMKEITKTASKAPLPKTSLRKSLSSKAKRFFKTRSS